jgi:hypothetical protein
MSEKFPIDEFDAVPNHGGRHRALRTGKTRALEFVKLLVIATAVAGIGYLGLQLVQSSSVFSGFIAQPSQTSDSTAVKVFDGTQENEAGTSVAKALFLEGFKVGDAENLIASDGKEVVVEKSSILISDEKYRPDAEKISKAVAIDQIELTADYPDPITVVVGRDYVKPTN